MNKKINRKTTIFAMAGVLILLIILKAGGLMTFRSGVRIGFAGNDGIHTFNGSYIKISGTMTHTLRPSEGSEGIHCEITTESGSLHVTITQKEDGSILCDREITGDETFDIPAEGKVSVKLRTEGHAGSYRFEY